MGDVIAFAEIVRVRRQRVARALHARCRELIAASLAAARTELAGAPAAESGVWASRVCKLEALDGYASALG